jgi:hypothetical protein
MVILRFWSSVGLKGWLDIIPSIQKFFFLGELSFSKGKGKGFQEEWPSFVVYAFGNSCRDMNERAKNEEAEPAANLYYHH